MEEYKSSCEYSENLMRIEKSYLSKEEFIDIITKMDFIAIRCADISFLTGVILQDEQVKELFKRIEIS